MGDSSEDAPIAKRGKALKKKEAVTDAGEKEAVSSKGVSISKATPKAKKASEAAAEGDAKVKKEKVDPKTLYGNDWQKIATPPETDPARKFYSSLLRQRPESEMAKRWCLRYGVLTDEESKKLWNELEKKGKSPAASKTKARTQPVKKESEDLDDEEEEVPKKKAKPSSAKAKKKKVDDEDDEDADEDVPIKKESKAKKIKKEDEIKKPDNRKRVMRDIAFLDGGLGGDDSDDEPLIKKARMKRQSNQAAAAAPVEDKKASEPVAASMVDDNDDDDEDVPLVSRRKK